MTITERQAKAERWDGKDRLVPAGNGLYLNVRRSSKTWLIRRRIKGKLRVRTLGKYPGLSVKEARAQTLAEALERTPSNKTAESLAASYLRDVVDIEHKRPELFRGYVERAVIPAIGSRRVVELKPADIAQVIQDYRVRSCLNALFGYAIETGVREDNPAAALTRRVAGYRPVARDRVLTDDELRRPWSIESHNGRVLRFLVLTGLRITEAQNGIQDGDLWRVPAKLSKNGKAH